MASRHKEHLHGYLNRHKSQPGTTNSGEPVRKPAPSTSKSDNRDHGLMKTTANSRSKAAFNSNKRLPIKISGKVKLEHIPDEIVLKIFGYFTVGDLLCATRVCKHWQMLANDNFLWATVFMKHCTPEARSKAIAEAPNKPPVEYWKSLFTKLCAERRNKKALRLLHVKKLNFFTGLPLETERALKSAGVFYQLVLVDVHKTEFTLRNSPVFYHHMSLSVRWFDLEMPPLNSIRQIRVYAATPLFFCDSGSPVKYSPFQRSLLMTLDINLQSLTRTTAPAGSDEMVVLHTLPQGLLLGTWKNDGEMAFLCSGFHNNQLLKRCLLGSPTRPYQIPEHTVIPDDIDASYGFHDYQCTVDIRTMRQSIWSQMFTSLHCKRESVGDGYAVIQLIRKDYHMDCVVLKKKLSFPWKTDTFKGVVENLVWLDVTVLDERKEPFWCISSPVKVTGGSLEDNLTFDFTNKDVGQMTYIDDKGKVTAEFSQMDHGEFFITSLDLMISLSHINKWFGTNY